MPATRWARGEVYRRLTGRYEVARALAFAPPEPTAPVPPAPILNVTVRPAPIPNVPVADTAGLTQAYAEASPPPPPIAVRRPGQEAKPLFQAMFTDVPRQGVSQTVSRLWAPTKDAPQPAAKPSSLYDLFRDPQPGLRKSIGGKV